jgi:ribosomal protein S18 acetylase RimI-like enzyme
VIVHIGPLAAEYAGEALTVQRAAYVTEAQRYAAPDLPPLLESLDDLRADLASGRPAFGAWLGPRLVGSVRGRPDGDRMEISRLAVAPDLQRMGIGGRLLAAVEAAAPPRVRTMWLITGAESDGSLALYRRAGYTVVGQDTDAAGVTLAVLEKPVEGHRVVPRPG